MGKENPIRHNLFLPVATDKALRTFILKRKLEAVETESPNLATTMTEVINEAILFFLESQNKKKGGKK